jgi:phage gpG-like protein
MRPRGRTFETAPGYAPGDRDARTSTGKIRMIRLVFNPEPLIARLGQARGRLSDMTPVHQDIGEYMVEQTRKRFVTSTAPDGTKWRPKTPATIARYKARGDGAKTKPLIGPSGRLGKEISSLATRDQVEFGSSLEYSAVMQGGAAKGAFGADKVGHALPWGNIPARVFIGISDSEGRSILDIVDEHLGGAIGD